ncbi:MAG TPA: hypothetical protein VK111_09705 [Virgibacillus sp.]|nr:hypothetical protein [Virgibacillus sp.]
MPDSISLKILDVFRPLFRWLGVDYPVMRNILGMKLMMDQRRQPSILSGSNKKPKGNMFLKSLGVYALYGLFLTPILFLGDNLMFQMSIIFGVTMFILMTSMVSDFSSVLLDVRDKTILHTKPISSKTISAAKVMHVAIYITMLTGAFIAVPALAILARKGVLFFLLFIVVLFLLVMLIIALTALIYIYILQFFSGEKLKDIINYMQIVLALGIIVGYQVLIRAFDFTGMDYTYDFSWWHILIPPMWFGAPFEMVFHSNVSSELMLLASLVIIVPVLAISLYLRMMPSFERNLQKLMEEAHKGKPKMRRLDHFWAKTVCFKKEERVFFHFASIMLSQEREFKLKVYPLLGMAFVFPFIFMFNIMTAGGTFQDVREGGSYFGIYFTGIMIAAAVHAIGSSGNHKGSWIFEATPVRSYKTVYSATLKAILVKLYVPVFLVLSAIFIGIFSARIVPDLLIVFVSIVLCTVIAYKLFGSKVYPFSQPFASMQEAGNSLVYFLFMFVVGAFAFMHFMVTFIPLSIALYVYFVMLSIITFFTWRSVFKERSALELDPPSADNMAG